MKKLLIGANLIYTSINRSSPLDDNMLAWANSPSSFATQAEGDNNISKPLNNSVPLKDTSLK